MFLARLSNDQGEPDAREETCMETQIYILIKMCEECMYYTHTHTHRACKHIFVVLNPYVDQMLWHY